LEELRRIVEGGLTLGESGTPLPPEYVSARRRSLTHALRTAERLGLEPWRLSRAHERWLRGRRLERAVPNAIRLLREGFDPPIADFLVDSAIRCAAIGGEPDGHSQVDRLEISRVARELAQEEAFENVQYVQEIHLVGAGGPTRAGQVFLELRGRAATHWLLACELESSTQPDDPWRLHPDLLSWLMQHPTASITRTDLEAGDLPRGFSEQTMLRLERLGVVQLQWNTDAWALTDEWLNWTVLAPGAELLERLAADQSDPMRLLARSMVRDAGDAPVLHRLGVNPGETRSVVEFSTALSHELRNALVPLRTAIHTLLEDAPAGDMERRAQLERRIKASLARLSDLAAGSALAATLGAHVAEEVSLRAVVEEAMAATAAERNGRVEVMAHLDSTRVRAPRQALVLAFVNLLRNAAQAAGSAKLRVWISAEGTPGGVAVTVRDDGPGVPTGLEERIFERGVSLRGGSGEGLHQVRAVLRGLGGSVACRPGTAGATFVLTFPSMRENP
jgi:signal transduction histidine kinase